ncbi:hypothetical protein CEUSTIGMA_g13015.t1 [Chlamydomonas eustigma]|uniref:Cysteine dioxygenase n=1 Tax=Chlamydomonas eustigma TaxID=1157962 RepID=A0A250XS26_9CHLO|nr:hypothetical protein CEUSTIGMA_g13015.t1 [Chlamydomonas eustigma]|eukprot:GAX85600.1 hypothetical protein CEUSTIGMA_g13015.t1 [Chlamydomonas eustigma]
MMECISSTVILSPQKQATGPNNLHAVIDTIKEMLHSESTLGHLVRGEEPKESFLRIDATVKTTLSAYANGHHEDWNKFAFFHEHHYVRNFVDGNEEFELMVICWRPGQVSRIHNHDKSHCWVACLHGEVQEVIYSSVAQPGPCNTNAQDLGLSSPKKDVKLPGTLDSYVPCPELEKVSVKNIQPGQVTYMNDKLGLLHSVGCLEGQPAPGAVTLHLYSPPIKRATLYDQEANAVITRVPGFFSVRGVRT